MLRQLRIDNLVLIREAELSFAPGLNVVTGETGAGKTILTQAVGLLLGAKGESGLVGRAVGEAYVEADLDLPEGILDDDGLEALAEIRPDGEPGLVVSRRVFGDGRSRAYAWGRSAPREDVAGIVERLVGMSGQFEQRRLARPAHQLELLDAFAGEEQLGRRREARQAWRALQAARRRRDELARDSGDRAARRAELQALVEAVEGLEPGAEESLRTERDRLRNSAGLAEAASLAAEAIAPEAMDGEGAADLASKAERSLAPAVELAPELAGAATEIRAAAERLREAATDLRGFLASLEAEPGRLEAVEERIGEIADARRRFEAASVEELLELAAAAREEAAALDEGRDPLATADEALAAATASYETVSGSLREGRRSAAARFAAAAQEELAALGLGDGELRVELGEREPGPTGADEASFLDPAERGPRLRSRREHRLGRGALAARARAANSGAQPGRGADDRVRRDRRGRRRANGPRGGGSPFAVWQSRRK